MKKHKVTIDLGGKKLDLTTGHVAAQASGAVIASYGETVVMATVVASPLKEDPGYFPLYVEYMERLYAGGRIKGSRWVKREGRPTDDQILVARLIDRSIRPLFPKDYKKNVQVIITVLSVDLENSPEVVACHAVSAAIAISEIPWKGPIGVVRVGHDGKSFITNPLVKEMDDSDLDLFVTATKDSIVMIESGSNQVPEDVILGGISHATKEAKKIISVIEKLSKKVGKDKEPVKKVSIDKSLQKKAKELSEKSINDLIKSLAKRRIGYSDYYEVKEVFIDSFEAEEKAVVGDLFDEFFKLKFRKTILAGKRPDGRKFDEIRNLSAEIEILPRTHGSAIFNRGETQVLSVATLGAASLEQLIETAEGEETKKYIHHYSMPPYSLGETGRVGYPSRREIGHGALAERALLPVIPSGEEFPYTIRVVSEILSSNGSTSMASTCGSTLSLMDAGVPIKSPVAGIAMGLIIEDEKKYKILTDIIGIEDGNGDMDFKVAGTDKGLTALQLDVKTLNLNIDILKEVLNKAKKARLEILKVMNKVISEPKISVSIHAPKIKVLKIPQEKIGEIIGPGGKTIRGIIAETQAQVDVEDDGSVNITAESKENLNKAVEKIELLTKELVAGEICEGEVKRMEQYGVFVEVLPGKEGLVHISDMAEDYVKDPSELVKMGDKVKVRVKGIDDFGRINLSMLLKGDKKKKKHNDSRDYKPFDKRKRRENFKGGEKQRRPARSSGPHFPASRLLNQEKKKFSR